MKVFSSLSILNVLFLVVPSIAMERTPTQDRVSVPRVQKLIDLTNSYKHSGPNCFASVFYTRGLIDDSIYVSSEAFEGVLSSSFCQKLTANEKPVRGDIVSMGSESHKGEGLWIHGALFLNESQVFAKMGFDKDDKTYTTSLVDNINFYKKQDPTLRTQNYRCDMSKLRQEIENSEMAVLWNRLLELRKGLFSEVVRIENVKVESGKHTALELELKVIQKEIKSIAEAAAISPEIVQLVDELVENTLEQIFQMDNFIVHLE